MQVPPGNFPHAVGSFQNPVVPPLVPPDNPTDLICVQFSRSWLPFVLGALSQLLLQSTWQGSDDIIERAQINAMLLRYLFSLADDCSPVCPIGVGGFELLIRQDPDNACFVQSSPDGTHWQTFIDLSLCNPGNAQPGAGSPQPQPGGGKANYCSQLNANGSLLLPTVVSTGDVIKVTSASGSAWDGTELGAGGALWRCYDGTEFSAGSCIAGTTRLVGIDPLPATPHMAVIVQIGGTRYPFVGNQIIVPGGVSGANVMLLVNDPPGTGAQGSFQICTEVTNNQPAHWTHTFDFTVSPGSPEWQPRVLMGQINGEWIPGLGWNALDFDNGTDSFRLVALLLTFPAVPITLTGVQIYNSFALGTIVDPATETAFVGDSSGSPVFYSLIDATPPSIIVVSSPSVVNNQLGIFLLTSNVHDPTPPDGSASISKVILSGTGADPF